MPITDTAYLRVTANSSDLIDQQSGKTIVSLYNNPTLIWHISSELRQQANGLRRASQSSNSSSNDNSSNGGSYGSNSGDSADNDQGNGFNGQRDASEVQNMQNTAMLLEKAEQNFPDPQERPPEQVAPPVAGAFELFSSAWADASGKYVILKKADGEIVYTDGHHWYSDQGVTKLKEPYPKQLTPIIAAYLASLAKDSSSHLDSLNQEMQETQGHIDKMTNRLNNLQSQGQNQSQDQPQNQGQDMVQFGTKQIPRAEAIRRLGNQINKAQKRIDSVQAEINAMPAETEAINKLIANFQS
jgi:hypothetical protein